jgi:phospholipid/cholesterol/gamma-HCH transport system permease protein
LIHCSDPPRHSLKDGHITAKEQGNDQGQRDGTRQVTEQLGLARSGARHDVAGDVGGNGDRRAVTAVTVADGLGTPAGDETTAAGDQTTTALNRAPGLTDGTRGLRGFWPGGAVVKPLGAVGGFFAMALDALMLIPSGPFAWREFLLQSWFVARVSLLPTLMLAIPFTVLTVFTFNILLVEFGAADYSGTGAAYGTVTQIGPVVTVLVVAGAGATAMCADLGARAIREELDALRVMGVNPIQALVVPRVLAATAVATLLSSLVMLVGLAGSFVFSVYIQHVTPGSFVGSLTLLTHAVDVVISLIKAALFGLAAGLIACYKGISVAGGPAGVGNAVNETVVLTFMALFAINIIVTAVGVKATL